MLQNPYVCSLLTRCTIPCGCHAKRHLNFQKWSEHAVVCPFWLGNVLRTTNGVHFFDIWTPKSGPNRQFFYTCDLEMCFAHNGVHFFDISTSKSGLNWIYVLRTKNSVHFFDISTSKSGPNMLCFVHFDLEMCFAPQQRALFRHLNFKKCSEQDVFAPLPLLFSLSFSSLISLASFLLLSDSSHLCFSIHLSILSEVWLLNFFRIV